MSKNLILIGARAMGRECFSFAEQSGFYVKGFLDGDPKALDGYVGYPPILGSVERYVPEQDDVFVCSLGDPYYKMKYVRIVSEKGGRFVSVVHPSSYVGKNVRIGYGCIICPNCTLTNDIDVGDHVIVNVGSSLSHDGTYGEGTTVSPGCSIAGRCKIGKNVFIGVGATLIPDITLGDGVYVAAGACVTKSFDAGRIMGVPAIAK